MKIKEDTIKLIKKLDEEEVAFIPSEGEKDITPYLNDLLNKGIFFTRGYVVQIGDKNILLGNSPYSKDIATNLKKNQVLSESPNTVYFNGELHSFKDDCNNENYPFFIPFLFNDYAETNTYSIDAVGMPVIHDKPQVIPLDFKNVDLDALVWGMDNYNEDSIKKIKSIFEEVKFMDLEYKTNLKDDDENGALKTIKQLTAYLNKAL